MITLKDLEGLTEAGKRHLLAANNTTIEAITAKPVAKKVAKTVKNKLVEEIDTDGNGRVTQAEVEAYDKKQK